MMRGGSRATPLMLSVLPLAFAAPPAWAQESPPPAAPAEPTQVFAIPAGPLPQVLAAYAAATGVRPDYPAAQAAEASSPGVAGRMTRAAALARLLAGTGLTGSVAGNVATIAATRTVTETDAGERVTGAVRVEGAQGSPYFGGAGQAAGVNGINGSRDVTATEGTGSFTSGALSIASKAPQAIKDVPQSVGVLTAERLQQQNVTDLNQAVRQLPGITVTQDSSGAPEFYSRGFQVTQIQVDGGAPFSTDATFGSQPRIDMAMYDHVEVVRGATGLFNGYGQPSGSINLVRKKPLDHAQFTVEGLAGSWRNYRLVGDATAPLALDGALRGRLILTYQNQHFFYRDARDENRLAYGVVELDATPTTLVTAGFSRSRQAGVPWNSGLPRYLDGSDIGLPRSTSFVMPWSRSRVRRTEFFGGIEQKLGGDWTAKLNLTDVRQITNAKYGNATGSVDPLTGRGSRLSASRLVGVPSHQFSTEAVVTGSFMVLGQRQEVTIGANRIDSDRSGTAVYLSLLQSSAAIPYRPFPGGPAYYLGSPNGDAPPIDIFAFDPTDPRYAEPPDTPIRERYSQRRRITSGAYASLRLTAFDRLHLTTGVRWNRYRSREVMDSLCFRIPATPTAGNPCSGRELGYQYDESRVSRADSDFSWPPAASLSYDITPALTGYVGYTDIYQSQSYLIDVNGNSLPPITGSNIEGGVKWQARDGKLNLSISLYRIEQSGGGLQSGPTTTVNGDTCCYTVPADAATRSEGVDTDLTGEILPGWQLAASYTFNRNKQTGRPDSAYFGLPLQTIQPLHLYKLWTSFDFGRGGRGPLSGLSISAGINGQSPAYRSGTSCVNLKPPNAFGVRTCRSLRLPDTVPFRFTVPAYALVSGRIDYRLTERWALALNVDNLLDKTYYQSVGNVVAAGNFYGAPRSVLASLRGKW